MAISLRPRHPRLLLLVGMLSLGLGGLTGCVTGRNTVTGHITPAHFEFTKIVRKSGPRKQPSGWWGVCIHAQINQGDSGAMSICKFEVGLPQRNEQQGDVSLEYAQQAAAEMANRAIYEVLSEAHPGTMLAVHCLNFKRLYERMLDEKIKGARVGMCDTEGVKTIPFDVPYHHNG